MDFKFYFYSDFPADLLRNYDLVVFHGIYFFDYCSISKKLRSIGVPYLVKPHSSLMIQAQRKSFMKKKVANLLFFNSFLNGSCGVVYTSDGECVRSYYRSNKIFIEPNGLDIPHLLNTDRVSERLRFIYLGRLDVNHKGLDVLLESLLILKSEGHLNKFDFDFYGKGDHADEQFFKKRLAALEAPTVNFYGPIYSPDKEIALSRSDVFVLTSRYEGVPMAILEALCQGVPCLVTPGTNIGESVSELDFGWVVEFDSYEISRKILAIINSNNDDLEKKRINARHYVESVHAWPQVVKTSESIFKSVIGI